MLQFYYPWKDKKTSFDPPENIRKPKVGLDWSKLKIANKESSSGNRISVTK